MFSIKSKVLAMISLLLALGISMTVSAFIPYKKSGIENEVILEISRGKSLNSISYTLDEAGIVISGAYFKWFAIATGKGKAIKSGEYHFREKLSMYQTLKMLEKGSDFKVVITIPEGKNTTEIFQILKDSNLENGKNYETLANSPEVVNTIPTPSANSIIEGFLFPETYFFSKEMNEKEILLKMIKTFAEKIPPRYTEACAKVGLTVYEAIILASIIEKETSIGAERPLISSVFHNRLKKRIPLATDPTVMYGIKNFDGNLTRKHLRTKTPYNTYLIIGLPPTPIANPGLESLQAAVAPSDTNYYYFVAKGNGEHHFSTTLQEHNRAVNKFQRYARKKEKDYRSY